MTPYTPKHNDLIYDVGLHKGEAFEFYLRKGFRVVAFEADPDLAASCRERLKEFIDDGQLTIVEGAIVDCKTAKSSESKVRFYKNLDNSVWGTILPTWSERNDRLGASSEVAAVNFSDAVWKRATCCLGNSACPVRVQSSGCRPTAHPQALIQALVN